jgi:CBS domain containing-hemolysin-like protein
VVLACCGLSAGLAFAAAGRAAAGDGAAGAVVAPWFTILTPNLLLVAAVLAGLSAFFSASEVAYFSLHKVKLRAMGESPVLLDRLAARNMDQPGALLATLLMGNTIVNVLLGTVLGEPMAQVFERSFLMPTARSYALSVAVTTAGLLLTCEVFPKVLVLRHNAGFAQAAAFPVFVVDHLMRPLRAGIMAFVAFLFRITRFSELPPAPFMTDDEFRAVLEDSKASGVIEEEERQMIQGIIEFSDTTVREILVPRPDMIALSAAATAAEALEVVREHEYSRMPVYRDDLDDIVGVLHAKDLLPLAESGKLDMLIQDVARPAHFVPETMSLADFLKTAQRLHSHLALVVDEYGGTRGMVTLQDALREVVGDIGEEDDGLELLCETLGTGRYRVDGALPLEDLENLVGIVVDDEEHTTVAGFLMSKSEKIPEVGDEIIYAGVRFRIEQVREKRVMRVLIDCPPELAAGEDGA